MSRLLPYETILKAREGDPEAVNAVLLHYAGYIRYFSKVNGQVNAEVEDYVVLAEQLLFCIGTLFKRLSQCGYEYFFESFPRIHQLQA